MKCNIVLSGSGIRFPYFIGVLEALEYHGYEITAIAGSSGGALISTLYAFTKDVKLIYDYLHKIDIKKYIGINLTPWKGYSLLKLNKRKLYSDVYNLIKATRIEESKIPLKLTVTNISSQTYEVIDKGIIYPYLLASMSIPVIFPYVKINNNIYADASICKNLLAECWVNERPEDEITFVIYFNKSTNTIKSFKDYITSIISTSISCNTDEEIEDIQKNNNVKLIKLYSNISSLDFDLYSDAFDYMVKSGFRQITRQI